MSSIAGTAARPFHLSWAWIVAIGLGSLLLAGVALRVFWYVPGVDVASARPGAVSQVVTAEGTVQTHINVNVSTQITGIIEGVYADQGDVVKKGQLLATLQNADLTAQAGAAQAAIGDAEQNVAAARATAAQAQENVAVANAGLRKANADLQLARANEARESQLFTQGYVAANAMDATRNALADAQAGLNTARATLDATRMGARSALATVAQRQAQVLVAGQNLKMAEASLGYTRIVAPMDGLIVERSLDVGNTVVPGNPIFVMAGSREVWAAALVDETVVGRVRAGQQAQILLRSGARYSGTVARISHSADTATREIEVDVRFVPGEKLALNEEAVITIVTARARGLVVPSSAVFRDAHGSTSVFITEAGTTTTLPVKTGLTNGEQTVLLSGVAPGDLVIVHPQQVKRGQRVRPIVESRGTHGPSA